MACPWAKMARTFSRAAGEKIMKSEGDMPLMATPAGGASVGTTVGAAVSVAGISAVGGGGSVAGGSSVATSAAGAASSAGAAAAVSAAATSSAERSVGVGGMTSVGGTSGPLRITSGEGGGSASPQALSARRASRFSRRKVRKVFDFINPAVSII